MSRYTVNGIQFISVTNVLDLLDKSDALIPWAVNSVTQQIFDTSANLMPKNIFELSSVIEDSKRKWRDISDEAKDIGSEIHKLAELYIKYGKDATGIMSDEVQNGFIAFLQWEENMDVTWIESEQPIVSFEYGYAGTGDALCRFGENIKVEKLRYLSGQTQFIDFKSSKGFYSGYDMQTAAYRKARMEINGLKGVSHNGPNGDYIIDYPDVGTIDGCGCLRLDKFTGIPEYKDYTKNQEANFIAFSHLLKFYYTIAKRRLKNNPHVILRENPTIKEIDTSPKRLD